MHRNSQHVGTAIGWSVGAFMAASLMGMAVWLGLQGIGSIPRWVLFVCAPLLAAATFIAVKRRDLRGIGIGLCLFVPAVSALAMAKVQGVEHLASDPQAGLVQLTMMLLSFVATAVPVVACLAAIVIPLAVPKKAHS